MTIDEAVETVKEIQRSEVDLIVPPKNVEFVAVDGGAEVWVDHPSLLQSVEVSDHSLQQISGLREGKVAISYLRKLKAVDPDFLATVLNHEYHRLDGAQMMRFYRDGWLRAVLSTSYWRFGASSFIDAIAPAVRDDPRWMVKSCTMTEHRFAIEVVMPNETKDIRVGEPCAFGFRGYTSGTGKFKLTLEGFVAMLVCLNGLWIHDSLMGGLAYRRVHKGPRVGDFLQALSHETIAANMYAIQSEMRDRVRALTNPTVYENAIGKMKVMLDENVEDPIAAIELLSDDAGFSEAEARTVQMEMIKSGDSTTWGMMNAVTAMAREHESYDRKVSFEEFAGKMVVDSRNRTKYMNASEESVTRKRRRRVSVN